MSFAVVAGELACFWYESWRFSSHFLHFSFSERTLGECVEQPPTSQHQIIDEVFKSDKLIEFLEVLIKDAEKFEHGFETCHLHKSAGTHNSGIFMSGCHYRDEHHLVRQDDLSCANIAHNIPH
ncbi:MAG: hypothetical protein DID90_2727553205 [Candidatus Nitrotoga sp. LAW]|nr:MAG: hypothetical protein DID90_2727553205 [Candidatus Nitrotoga sp. LAW]